MSEKFKILLMARAPFRDELGILEEIADIARDAPDREKLIRLIPDCHAYFASLEVRVTPEIIDAGRNLLAIATPSTGTDHIDMEHAKQRGVEVISLKNDLDFLKQVTATAELAFGLLLAAVRKIPWGFEAAKKGWWARDRFRGMQLSGKTFGILGFGRLGEITARYARGFRMNVIACDLKRVEAEGVRQVDFDTLLRESDIISIHLHPGPGTENIMNREAFSRMKDGVVIINTSRGAVIDEAALAEALESGRVGAAGLDVIRGEWEPCLRNHPLIEYAGQHENLVITPHLGGVTRESQEMAYRRTAGRLYSYLKNLKKGAGTPEGRD